MKRKEILQKIGSRLLGIRNSLGLKKTGMANRLGISISSYYKNEKGENCPDVTTLRVLADEFKLSLDWLVLGRGEKMYKSPVKEILAAPGKEGLRDDIKELINHMDHIPLLRYEVLTMFHKFKESKKTLVEEAMKPGTE